MNAVAEQLSEYELVLMLDPEIPDERRDQIAADALKRIEAGGKLKHDRAWGMRKLAYEIRQRTEADYRFFRFETERPLLEELDHSLKITDGVLRFRVFRVDPDSPVIEPPPPVALAGSAPGRGPGARRGGPGGGPSRRSEPAEAPAAEPSAPEPPAPEAAAETAPPEPPAAETAAPEAPPPEAPADQPPAQPSEAEPAPEPPEGEAAAPEPPEGEAAAPEGDEPARE